MAETTSSKNEQFLQQLERQRLSKRCNRSIDLRGKVSGECLAYTFGDKTHYLDDRSYLVAKQLLARFKGKYTFAVYEAVLNAVKAFNQQASTTVAEEPKQRAILFNDANNPQLLPFDQQINRQAERIVFSTPISLSMNDMLYNGSTIDITTTAIRISLKRAYILKQGNEVAITFSELTKAEDRGLLTDISYKISHIQHSETHTQAILLREYNDNIKLSTWLDRWTESNNSSANQDHDNKLLKIAIDYYQRFYTQSLNSALLWVSSTDQQNPIKAFHLMPCAASNLADVSDILRLLAINHMSAAEGDRLIATAKLSGKRHTVAVARSETLLVAKLLNWSEKNNATTLLLQKQTQSIDTSRFDKQLRQLSKRDPGYARQLTRRLEQIDTLFTLSDISTSTVNTESVAAFSQIELNQLTLSKQAPALPSPSTLAHYFTQSEARFYIKTAITIHVNGKKFQLTTTDGSATGLSFNAPNSLTLTKGMKIVVDFDRWQSQTKKVKLTNLPYTVKNIFPLLGEISVGMERNTVACAKETNHFFTDILEKNKDALAKNNQDIITPNESHIFSSLLSESLTNTPLYFGMSNENKRILQAVASTQTNQAESRALLWQALTKVTAQLSETLKNLDPNGAINFGVYCYQNHSNAEWAISSDLALSSAAEKAVFINRAMAHKHHLFFQCTLSPFPADPSQQEQDLAAQLAQLRPNSPHKVKKIKDILQHLFAIGELKDVTDIIKSAY